QGGDPRVVDDTSLLPLSPCRREVLCTAAGFVTGFDTEGVGRAAMLLGAGRATKDDTIDPGAGLLLHVRVGDCVAFGECVVSMYAQSEDLLDSAEERLLASIRMGPDRVEPPALFHAL
ncbi:MAG: thymidine phosphorylase, partial [Actinomycetota bacterium]|nr:thymidine phosphorylase [Actinomycetota bacterium]